MMYRRTITLLCAGSLLLLSCLATGIQAQETAARHIPWQKVPIAVELTVGEERLVHFPGAVSVGVPATLDSSLRTQTVNGTVYWRAAAPFATTRVAIRELDSGRMYLIDLQASLAPSDNAPIRIMLETPASGDGDGALARGPVQYDYVHLTRFAAQQLYAPARLVSALPGVVRAPLQQDTVPLVRGGAVEATPLIAWRAGSHFVTAVKLVNQTTQPQVLDPRALRGQWLSAAFQHARLLPAGDEADTTVVYLVSAQPFAASVLP
jgi:integrating conjugative element protein (TIGR03749 family)